MKGAEGGTFETPKVRATKGEDGEVASKEVEGLRGLLPSTLARVKVSAVPRHC